MTKINAIGETPKEKCPKQQMEKEGKIAERPAWPGPRPGCGCQKFATKPHAPASELKTIPLAWPFAQWGLDMVGPLRKSSKGGHTHLLVAVDKFTKWIEATPITNCVRSDV